jgi:LysR family transcriptional regulator, cell division regulator
MIGVHDLRCFRAAATSTSLRQAARALLITQPALTHIIKRLEEQVGHTLFERRRTGVMLTPAGVRLLTQVDPLITAWENLGKDLTDADEQLAGRLSIGCHPAVAPYTVAKFLPQLLRRYPRLDVRLVHGLSRQITEYVNAGVIDLGIVVNPFGFPDLFIRPLLDDEVTFFAAKGCVPGVLICEPSLGQTQTLLRKIATKKPHPFPRIVESPSLDVCRSMAEAGLGTAILPARVAAQSRRKLERLDHYGPPFKDRICLVHRPLFHKTVLGRTIISAALATEGRDQADAR